METNDAAELESPLHTPDGTFVIHLRSDSDVAHQQLVGRVEHVMSGDSSRFVSLDELLAFMVRHVVRQAAVAGQGIQGMPVTRTAPGVDRTQPKGE